MDKDISKYLVERLALRKERLFILKWIDTNHEFDDLYANFRKFEKRVYTDDELSILPFYKGKAKSLTKEWKQKKHATDLLIDYLKGKYAGNKLNILDLGCANGWLSQKLADIEHSSVYALDIVMSELVQASTVFDQPNLQFIYGNFYRDIFPANSFHTIILSNTVEYFPNLDTLFKNIMKVLKKGGEVHILNTPLHKPDTLDIVEKKNIELFKNNGFELMKRHYFYYTLEDLIPFEPIIQYDPSGISAKISRNFLGKGSSPYYWLTFRKTE